MIERAVASLARRLPRPAHLSPLVAHVLLAVGSIAVVALAIVGAELLARRWAPDYLVETRGLHVFSRTYGWAGRPGAVAPMGGGRVSLNARGYRGRELTLPKAGDRTRVVVLGDSIAFGYGVSDEQTFPYLLDVRDNGIEVGNLAVEGYGPGQELLVLLHDGLRARSRRRGPRRLSAERLRRCGPARSPSTTASTPQAPFPSGRRPPRPRRHRRAAIRRRARPSVAQRLFAPLQPGCRRSFRAAPAPEDEGWRYRKQEVLRDEDYALRLSFALVMEMENACRRHGIRFLVATFPNGISYDMPPGLPERFRESLQAEGVWVVDMGARFRALGVTPAALALDRTGHLGPRGHVLTRRDPRARDRLTIRRPGPAGRLKPPPGR